MKNEGLQSCPFCGGEAEVLEIPCGFMDKEMTYIIYCKKKCGANVRGFDRGKTLKAWNTRPTPSLKEIEEKMFDILWENLPKSFFEDVDFEEREPDKIQKVKRMKGYLLDTIQALLPYLQDNRVEWDEGEVWKVLAEQFECKENKEDCSFQSCNEWGRCVRLVEAFTIHFKPPKKIEWPVERVIRHGFSDKPKEAKIWNDCLTKCKEAYRKVVK